MKRQSSLSSHEEPGRRTPTKEPLLALTGEEERALLTASFANARFVTGISVGHFWLEALLACCLWLGNGLGRAFVASILPGA